MILNLSFFLYIVYLSIWTSLYSSDIQFYKFSNWASKLLNVILNIFNYFVFLVFFTIIFLCVQIYYLVFMTLYNYVCLFRMEQMPSIFEWIVIVYIITTGLEHIREVGMK